MALDLDKIRWDDHDLEKITEMVSRRVAIDVESGRAVVWSQLKKGAITPIHTHAGDQWIQVRRGSIAVTVRGVPSVVAEGGSLTILGGAPHQVEALDDSIVLDVRDGDVEFRSS